MALKFNRNFKNGRQSEQFLNDELITLYETFKYLPHHKQDHEGQMPPAAKLPGAINAQIPAGPTEDSSLNYWNGVEWVPFFKRKFQITDQILVYTQPSDPVIGQLWINNGALYYFDGKEWQPVKTTEVNDSQWSTGAFADFELVSPLNPIGQYVVPIDVEGSGAKEYIYNYSGHAIISAPGNDIVTTDRIYYSGQNEVSVHLNGILLLPGRDFEEYTMGGTKATERGQICNQIHLLLELRAGDVAAYHISRKMAASDDTAELSANTNEQSINEDYGQYFHQDQLDYIQDNTVIGNGTTWTPDWTSPELDEPTETIIIDEQSSQFPIPNINTDRIFLDNLYDDHYIEESTICFKYKTKDVIHKTISAIHLNPGKITDIRKRLIKVDKVNATIAVSPYNTEFYGFRSGEFGGHFLIPSLSQDYGDYVSAGDHIILNYHTNQNYDYILAVTYEFAWMKADGTMVKNRPADLGNSFYLTNLREPINVHANGVKLEEASYSVDMSAQTVTFDDDTENVTIGLWSPYKKQFGYIRETDLQRRGIIKLREPVYAPLVFVGGLLIHPLYGGLEFSEDGQYIYVPNTGNVNQMKNMQWCVVDLASNDEDIQTMESGLTEETTAAHISVNNSHLDGDDMYYDGTLTDDSDENGIRDFILDSGYISGMSGVTIRYDVDKIGPRDGIILFIEGLLVDKKDIIRNATDGYITVEGGLVEGQEYVLLKDIDGSLYDSSTMIPSLGTGLLSDSLVYFNGKLLCNTNCVATINTPEQEIKDGAVDQEIHYFITDEVSNEGRWAIYNQFTYQWIDLEEERLADVLQIVNSYENLLTNIRLNISYTDADDIVIYTFKFANDLVGLTEIDAATYIRNDEEDGTPIFTLGTGHYLYNAGTLNLYRNGVKLIKDIDYEEMPEGKEFRMLSDFDVNDEIQYIVEPIERGYTHGHKTAVLTKDDAVHTNIYRIDDTNPLTLYPGRVTVYINGIRIPDTDWSIVTPKTIMLRYEDYLAVGSTHNYPEQEFVDGTDMPVTIRHDMPDTILVEVRQDYDRKEKTVALSEDTLNELYIEPYEINQDILETKDEILFYINGQFAGISRNKHNDYRLDRYKGCIAFMNPDFIQAITKDELKALFDQNNYIYTAWKKMTGNTSYQPGRKNTLTLVWR